MLNSERFVPQLLCAQLAEIFLQVSFMVSCRASLEGFGAVQMVRVNEVEDGDTGGKDQDLAQALAQRGLAQTIL